MRSKYLFFVNIFVYYLFRVIANDDRQYGVWLGAKAFCAPGTRRMQDLLWISKDDWLEEGPAVVARKVRVAEQTLFRISFRISV